MQSLTGHQDLPLTKVTRVFIQDLSGNIRPGCAEVPPRLRHGSDLKIPIRDVHRDRPPAKAGTGSSAAIKADIPHREEIDDPLESTDELDRLDLAIAVREGHSVAEKNASGKAARLDQTPYQPTRDLAEAFRLMVKYVVRMNLSQGVWSAVGHNGRAYSGSTALIAICRAAAG